MLGRAGCCDGLTAECIQLSQNDQYNGHYRLLQLFAYGTYEDYLSVSVPPNYRIPNLNLVYRGEGDLPSPE